MAEGNLCLLDDNCTGSFCSNSEFFHEVTRIVRVSSTILILLYSLYKFYNKSKIFLIIASDISIERLGTK